MVDIRFSRNEYTWANQGIVPAMADAVELTKTIQQRALEALRAHRATLGEDTAVRIYVGATEPVGAAHGDFWWNGDNRQRKDSWAGETSRTNLFTDQRPLEAMPNHYVQNGTMSLYLGNEIRYVMTTGGEFRAGFTITGTGTHTFAFEFRSTTVSALRSFHLRTSDGAIDRYVVLPAYEEWLRVEDTVTGPVQVYLTPEMAENPDAGDVVFIKNIIVEAGTDAGVFFDGAMPMCSWTGTPGLSTSVYTPGWTNAPALSDLIAILTQTSYQDGYVDIYLGQQIPLLPGEGDLWDDGSEFKVFDGMGWVVLVDDTGTVIDETIRERVTPIIGEIIDPIILPIKGDIERIDDELVVVGTEVTVVSDWVNGTGAQLDANLAQAQIDLAAAQAALNAAIDDLDTLENITLPALDLELSNTQTELDTLANTTLPALDIRLGEAESDLSYLSSTTLPALNTQITDAQDVLNAAFPSGVFNVEGALDTTITGTVIEYAVNSSETVAPTTGWSTTQPTRTPGTFVWFRTKITYGSGSTNTSSAALLTGNTGATGPEGPQGSQGIQGPPGADGVSTYTWLKYADTPTSGMSDTPAGKTYMGLAHNKPTATESSNYADYQWSLIKGEDGIDGEPGIPGPPGADGQTTYTWVKYADNASGGGMADLPTGKTYIGLAFNKTTATESTTPGDYQWSLIQGPQGPQGIQGPPGADGQTTYTWIKYADTPTTGMADLPAGKTYMGIAVNKTTPTESSTYSDYQWSLIQGPQGAQGIPGTPGDDGITYYTWIKYSSAADGTNPSDDPTGRPYIGIAYNKATQTESTNKADYTWSLIQGPQGPQGPQGSQGIQGPPGEDGVQLYTWLKYADTPTTGMDDLPTGKTYMGVAYNKTTATESTNYSDYQWSLIKGADGAAGKGISTTVVTYQVHSNGTTAPTGTWQATPQATAAGQFLWTRTITTYTDASTSTAYSVAAHGSTGAAGRSLTGTTVHYQTHTNGTTAPTGTWLTTVPATSPGQFLWTRTVTSYSSAPTSVTSYSVAKHGESGAQGIQGPPGADGQPTYTWIKYGTSSAGAGMSDDPTGKTYIGIAYNKTTQTESNVATDYAWSLIQGPQGPQGPQGSQGIQGPPGADGNPTYIWLKYADTPTTGMSDTPTGKTYMGIAYNKPTPTESSTYSDYAWSLIQGPQGNQGVQGPPGADGQPTYTWIKYADSATGTGLSDSPAGKTYIGFAHNKTTATESSTPGDYTWSLIQGPQGPQGNQGIQGPPGADGQTTYTWLKYADTPTTGMSDTPTGKTYMGLAYNKTTATESTNYADYAWSLIKGADGAAGADGKGISTTTVTYQTHSNGTTAPTGTWSSTPTATTVGQFLWTRTETTYTDATKSTSYSVAAHGATGPGGATGAAGRGITGTTVEYQASGSGTIAPTGTWSASIPATTPGQWLWTRTTTTFSSAPSPVLSYAVAKHGETGQQGVQGPPGADGQPTYTWIKYADSAAGAGMSDSPTGKAYIGLAFNKTTATESTTPGDYQWALIQGAPGADGISITSVTPYFRQQTTGTAAPAVPTASPPPAPWVSTEPTYAPNTEMWRTDRIVYSNDAFSYTPVYKSSSYDAAAAAEAAAKAYADAQISKGVNLIDNPSRLGSVGRWVRSSADGVLSVEPRQVNGISSDVLKFYSVGSVQAYSAVGSPVTDFFPIDPTKAYQFSVWIEDEKIISGTQLYFGLNTFNAAGTATYIRTVAMSTGVEGSTSNNPYFMSTATPSVGSFTRYVGYLMPMGTDPANMKGLGVNVSSNYILQADARWGRMRVLNWANTVGTGPRSIWIAHPTVVEVDPLSVEMSVKAQQTADAAMVSANGKNINTYTDLVRPALPGSNPSTTGRRLGDVHRWRYTDNGEVIKEIILNASNAWQDIKFGDSVLTTLDVGKLTAGTAAIQTAVIQKLAVEIATVIELAADRITSGTIAAGRIDTTALAAAIATIIELDAGTIVSGTIDTARLNATEIAAQIATIIELNASRIVAGEIGAARINTTELATALANIITANIENLRVGTGTMDTAVINKLWTDVVRSRKITTDMLIVGSGENLVADPYFVDTELSNARVARSQGTWARVNELPLEPSSPLVFQVPAGGTRYLRLLGVDLVTESAWGSRVEPGAKYRVRYDYRRAGTVSTATVRPLVRWVNHLGTVTTDTPRAAYAGTTTSWQQDEVEWVAPATAVTAWLEIHVNAGSSGTTVQVKNPLFVSKVDPSLLVDGLISAELGLNTSGVVRAGNGQGAATELSLDGISIYTSGESTNSRSRRIHLTPYGDQSLHMVGEYEGNAVDFGFDSTGGASARVVTASEDVYIDGKPLLGARANSTVTEESWLDNSGLGPVAWGDLSAANPTGPVHTGSATTMIGYITFDVVAGRRYRISMGYGMTPELPISASGARIGCHFKYQIYAPGQAPPPGLLTSAPTLLEVQNHATWTGAIYGTSSFVWNCPTTGQMRLGVTLNTLNCGGKLHRGSEQAWKLYVDDIGVWTGLPDLAVAPAAAPKQTFTSIWTPSSLVTYQGQNNPSWGSYNGVQQVNKINQGSWETAYVQRWGVAGFLGNAISGETTKTISSALSGATINSVKVRLNNSFSASPSVKARIGWQSTQTAVPVIQTSSAGISVGSSVTTTLPTAAHTAISGGNRYITVGPGTSTARSEYAFFHGTTGNANQIMQLIINYTR